MNPMNIRPIIGPVPDMVLDLERIVSDANSTMGILSVRDDVDSMHKCFTIEDPHQEKKIPGITRIAAGTYEIGTQDRVTNMTTDYRGRFPEFFDHHLMLLDVPEFEDVYLHIGNKSRHSEGCILLNLIAGQTAIKGEYFGQYSKPAFIEVYKMIRTHQLQGGRVWLIISNVDGVQA